MKRIFSLGLAFWIWIAAAAPALAIRVGETAPDFLAEDVRTGEPVSLGDHEGRVVVLIFFAVG